MLQPGQVPPEHTMVTVLMILTLVSVAAYRPHLEGERHHVLVVVVVVVVVAIGTSSDPDTTAAIAWFRPSYLGNHCHPGAERTDCRDEKEA